MWVGVSDSFIKSCYAIALLFWQHQKELRRVANISFTALAYSHYYLHCAVLIVRVHK